MSGVRSEVVNLQAVTAALAALGPRVEMAAAEAAMQEAHYEFGLTQLLVPILSGDLRDSGRVEGVDIEADILTVGIAYGGPAGVADNVHDVDYALAVHEDLEMHHSGGRTAKFVERPVREELESGRAATRMGYTISKLLGL